MSEPKVLMDRKFGSFESFNDLVEEFVEAQEQYGFLGKAGIPDEYRGTLHVVVTYTEDD